jgi:hypothetical protein
MKVKVVLGIVAIMVGVAGVSSFRSFQVNAIRDLYEMNLSKVDQAEILSATLQIEISVPIDSGGDRFVRAKGLGSLVRDGEETLLVTHNHWGDVLKENAIVAFFDIEGRLIKTISGLEFKSLVLCQDAGTLILRSPIHGKGLLPTVLKDDSLKVQVGDVVLVSQRQGPERKIVTLVEAEIDSIRFYEGLPVFRLKGSWQPVQGGDSGGGVWYRGSLIGNLYATIMVEPPFFSLLFGEPDEEDLETTTESYAAIYHAELSKAFQESLERIRAGKAPAEPGSDSLPINAYRKN